MDELITQMVSQYAGQGIFIGLFFWLLSMTIKNNKDRELKLQEIIKTQGEALTQFASKYDMVIDNLKEIKGKLK